MQSAVAATANRKIVFVNYFFISLCIFALFSCFKYNIDKIIIEQ